jgi:hypothetical protein
MAQSSIPENVTSFNHNPNHSPRTESAGPSTTAFGHRHQTGRNGATRGE